MSSTEDSVCSHCKDVHPPLCCPVLIQQQMQAHSLLQFDSSAAKAADGFGDGSVATQAGSSNQAHPSKSQPRSLATSRTSYLLRRRSRFTVALTDSQVAEGLTYNGGAYLCPDTNTAISDNNDDSNANGSDSMPPRDPYANSYPTVLGSNDLASTIANRFNWAGRRSISAGTAPGTDTGSGRNTVNVENNDDFNIWRASQPSISISSPPKQESEATILSLPSAFPPLRRTYHDNDLNNQQPSQSSGSTNNANSNQQDLMSGFSSFSSALTSTDYETTSHYGDSSTSEYQAFSSPARPTMHGMIPTAIQSFVPSINHGQYIRPSSFYNDQRTVPGPYRYNGYANNPAMGSNAGSYGRGPANDNVGSPVTGPLVQHAGHNPDLSHTAGQHPLEMAGIPLDAATRQAIEYQRNAEAQATIVEHSFNLRPMPKAPVMQDYCTTPTFAVECLQNYAKDLQSWAFELSLHTTRLESVLNLPGQLAWAHDSFAARLILNRTPENAEGFKTAMAASETATKAMIHARNVANSMNVSPTMHFQAAGQQSRGATRGVSVYFLKPWH